MIYCKVMLAGKFGTPSHLRTVYEETSSKRFLPKNSCAYRRLTKRLDVPTNEVTRHEVMPDFRLSCLRFCCRAKTTLHMLDEYRGDTNPLQPSGLPQHEPNFSPTDPFSICTSLLSLPLHPRRRQIAVSSIPIIPMRLLHRSLTVHIRPQQPQWSTATH
ncbi:hypothetical protein IQ06DRAFT_55930 [Phaeosphaeriaceae sp. SRC1lsM3a]|nr:hypothetical protein IQ06DRAFT_55930 [Stagonospora sp. SRC1lsM3a]